MRRFPAFLLVIAAACSKSGGDSAADGGPRGDAAVSTFPLPPANGKLDYQLGGAYALPAGVTIVSRDRNESPAAGAYSICYVNGFQIQPDEESFWSDSHPELILRDGGAPVIDTDWNEMLLDVGDATKRAAIAEIVAGWIEGCHAAGFDAIEIDNLDSYTRSHALLDEDDAVAAIRLFADAAHARGMAIAQKNGAELVGRREAMGTDFVVAEQCQEWKECDVYTSAYGDAVLVIEYQESSFDEACRDFPALPIVLRDVDLRVPGDTGYVYDGC